MTFPHSVVAYAVAFDVLFAAFWFLCRSRSRNQTIGAAIIAGLVNAGALICPPDRAAQLADYSGLAIAVLVFSARGRRQTVAPPVRSIGQAIER